MDESKSFCRHRVIWITYNERLSYYFEANSITDANRKKAVVLSACGTETFSLLKDHITPYSLRDKTFDKQSQALEEHCNPTSSVIVELFNFYMCWQRLNRTISDFIAHLKKTKSCEFGPTIQDMLRDLLVVGVADDRIRRRKKKLNFDQAKQIALAVESADKMFMTAACSKTITLTQPNISRIDRGNSGRGKSEKSCFRCDG